MSSKPPPFLVLPREAVRSLVSLDDHLAAVELAFRLLGEGRAELAPPMHLRGMGGDFHAKGAVLPLERDYAAVKVNGNFPGNGPEFGLPTIQGAILLFDAGRGCPLALLDSIEITSARTGAASALAARYLANPHCETLTLCGCGEQGRAQLESIANVLPIRRGFAWDRDRARAEGFAHEMRAKLAIAVEPASHLAEAAGQSDAIVTCTTATEPFLEAAMVRPGTFIAAVGADSPAKQELDPLLLARSAVYADVREQALAMGDTRLAVERGLMQASAIAGDLGELVTGRTAGRTSNETICIFDSTGAAVQDVAAAAMAYERALASGSGLKVRLA